MIRRHPHKPLRGACFGLRVGSCLVLLAALFGSCVNDPYDPDCSGGKGPAGNTMTFRINIPQSALPSTRVIPEGGEYDNEVAAVTFLLFDADTGTYTGKVAAMEVTVPDADTPNIKIFAVSIPEGAFDALVIANADDILAELEAADPDLVGKDMDYFRDNLTTTVVGGNGDDGYVKWDSYPGLPGYKPFPMAGRVDIPADRTLPTGTVFLTRMLAKVNVRLAFEQTYDGDPDTIYYIKTIAVPNYNTRGNLLPGYSEGETLSVFDPSQLNIPAAPGYVSGGNDNLLYYGYEIQSSTAGDVELPDQQSFDEMFLPEFDSATGVPCLLMEIFIPSLGDHRWFRVDLEKTNPATATREAVNLLRNFSYTLNIISITGYGFGSRKEAYDSTSEGIVSEITAVDESDMNDITFDGRYQLTTDTSYIVFNAEGAAQDIKVFTDYPGGWEIVENTVSEWLIPWVLYGPGGVTTTVGLTQDTYNGGTVQSGVIIIEAGPLRKTIEVVRVPLAVFITGDSPAQSGFTPYVGAFWRAGQTGERLIRMNDHTTATPEIDGSWVAVVLDGYDWIDLDTEMTNDPHVTWTIGADESGIDNGNDPGFDVRHQVTGNRDWVNGSIPDSEAPRGLYFRIGLNGPYTATADAPARYGVILLAYNNYTKMQRIWVRQGEGADFLFRRDDPVNSVGVTSRANAVRFSPYNLTAETLNAQVYKYGTTTGGTTASRFTDYPSQDGAYFVWAANIGSPVIRYAWDRITDGVPPGWMNVGNAPLWNDLSADNETCPEGYRRPSDGPEDRAIYLDEVSDLELSEVRLSLFDKFGASTADMNNTNSSSGYYADGFFDRRSSPGDVNVATDTNDIASMGTIYYNMANNASLFFPTSGSRNGDGTLRAGSGYWTTATNLNSRDCRSLSGTRIQYGPKYFGYAIRCVKRDEL